MKGDHGKTALICSDRLKKGKACDDCVSHRVRQVGAKSKEESISYFDLAAFDFLDHFPDGVLSMGLKKQSFRVCEIKLEDWEYLHI